MDSAVLHGLVPSGELQRLFIGWSLASGEQVFLSVVQGVMELQGELLTEPAADSENS